MPVDYHAIVPRPYTAAVIGGIIKSEVLSPLFPLVGEKSSNGEVPIPFNQLMSLHRPLLKHPSHLANFGVGRPRGA